MERTDGHRPLGRLLGVKEVAQLLQVHPNTVRAWSDRGVIPSYRIGPRGDRRFAEEEVLGYLNSNHERAKAPEKSFEDQILENFTHGPDGGLAPPELRNMYTVDR